MHEGAHAESDIHEDPLREVLADPEAGTDYLRDTFLATVAFALIRARKEARLTQAQVAERLGTRQSAIARWEHDTEGSITFRRFVDYLQACERLPLEIPIMHAEALRVYALEDPDASRSGEAVRAWHRARTSVSLLKSTPKEVQVSPATDQSNPLPVPHYGAMTPIMRSRVLTER